MPESQAMLAHEFEKRKKHLKFPVFTQPKLDGIRCIATKVEEDITFVSRNNKPFFFLDHLKPQLNRLLIDEFEAVDGELWIPNTSSRS